MKYLSDYTKDGLTAIFDKYGVFFAFSDKQFKEQCQPDIKYVSISGMICPKEHANTVQKEIAAVGEAAIKQDLAENGQAAIIRRELCNHECYYTGDVEQCVDALDGYAIAEEDIMNIYREESLKEA